MVERIKNEILIKNVVVKKLSENNYRVIVGPFTNIKSLQNGYIYTKVFTLKKH